MLCTLGAIFDHQNPNGPDRSKKDTNGNILAVPAKIPDDPREVKAHHSTDLPLDTSRQAPAFIFRRALDSEGPDRPFPKRKRGKSPQPTRSIIRSRAFSPVQSGGTSSEGNSALGSHTHGA